MTKKNKTPIGIFIESTGLYFSNFKQFVKYMTFPVLGQVFGLALVFLFTYFLSKNMPYLIEKYSFFDNFNTLIGCSVIAALPGLVIFMKAFWEYLIAYGAINSMLDNMLKSGKVYDFQAHTELIKRRSTSFIMLWLLFGIFSIIAVIPFFWVIAGILAVFFVLTFQVFTYEPEQSPIGCVKKSFLLIKGHFGSTFMLMTFAGVLTYLFLPKIVNSLFDILNISRLLSNAFIPMIEMLPVENLNSILPLINYPVLKIDDISKFFVTTLIAQIIIQYTLPMRSLLWGMWYRELNGQLPAPASTAKKAARKKRPSEKLMEETHKKYGTKKLDSNILKRASEKDNNE